MLVIDILRNYAESIHFLLFGNENLETLIDEVPLEDFGTFRDGLIEVANCHETLR